jgi:hypothetical protein
MVMTDRITVTFTVTVAPTDDLSSRSIVMGAVAHMLDDNDLWPSRIAIDIEHNVAAKEGE